MSAFDGATSRFGLTARTSAGRQTARTRTSGDVNAGAALTAFLRRDLAENSLFRAGLVLDLGYGLVNLLIFQFISRVLHHPGGDALDGASSYFDFVAIGLAYLLVVQAACAQLTNRVRDQQRDGTLEVTVAAPVSPGTIALGLAGYPMLLGTLRCVIYLTAAAILLGLDVSSTDWYGLVVMVLLGALAALGIGICLAAIAVAFSHGDAVGRAAVVTLGLLSGAYFPIAAMPAPMRWIAQVLPTRMAIEGLRAAMAGGGWLPTALLLATTSAVLVPVAIWLFARGLRRARSTGTLVRG